jgi:hypothetical protein
MQFYTEAMILAWKSFLSRDVTERYLVFTDVLGRPIGLICKCHSRPLNIPLQSREETEENCEKKLSQDKQSIGPILKSSVTLERV